MQYRLLFHGLAICIGFVPPLYIFLNMEPGFQMLWKVGSFSILIIPFYILNVGWLVPYLLKKRRYLFYVGALALILTIYRYVYKLSNILGEQTFMLVVDVDHAQRLPNLLIPPIMPFLFFMFMGTCFELLWEWEKRGKLIEKAEREKLAAELSFLKSQINPHFFFNTLNSIYALAKTDANKTQQAVLLLSHLMRYILYESNVERIALAKEVEFLHHFVALHRIRHFKSNNKSIRFKHNCEGSRFEIEPLLLVPFVENAFKHSHSYYRKSEICISVQVEKCQKLVFMVSNTIGEFAHEVERNSGLGLENIKKRLELLYPEKHELVIKKSQHTFLIILTLFK